MTTLVLIGLTVIAVVGLVAWIVMRQVRRSVFRWRNRMLKLRSYVVAPGARRDVVLLRRRLSDEMRSARRLLAAAPDARMFQAQAGPMFAEMLTTAAALDAELADVERFADPAQQRMALAIVAPQVRLVIDTSYAARQTVLGTAAADRARELDSLHDTVAREAASLAAYRRAKDDLTL